MKTNTIITLIMLLVVIAGALSDSNLSSIECLVKHEHLINAACRVVLLFMIIFLSRSNCRKEKVINVLSEALLNTQKMYNECKSKLDKLTNADTLQP
jgi:hypothetical protein